MSVPSIFSIDVEDWFHILDLPDSADMSQWDRMPTHVVEDCRKLLDVFDEQGVKVTCFFLGWVGRKFPHLVREAADRGHEVASHGYSHRLVYSMTPREFYDDAVKAKQILEDILGKCVNGYRAPGFSVTSQVPWFFDQLTEAGYTYDSSIFPASRGHGGMKTGRYAPYRINDQMVEFPITVARFSRVPACLFGGGYLRLAPLSLIQRAASKILNEGRPVIYYVHPREVNPAAPRVEMPLRRSFKCYVNVASTEAKIRSLIGRFEMTTFQEYIRAHFSPGIAYGAKSIAAGTAGI
jgi:polysaccharide deacetylase family protein (PEP-CTERM system associated)